MSSLEFRFQGPLRIHRFYCKRHGVGREADVAEARETLKTFANAVDDPWSDTSIALYKDILLAQLRGEDIRNIPHKVALALAPMTNYIALAESKEMCLPK